MSMKKVLQTLAQVEMLMIMIINFRTDRCGQTVQTQIRLVRSGLHRLPFHLHLDKYSGLASLFEFKGDYSKVF